MQVTNSVEQAALEYFEARNASAAAKDREQRAQAHLLAVMEEQGMEKVLSPDMSCHYTVVPGRRTLKITDEQQTLEALTEVGAQVPWKLDTAKLLKMLDIAGWDFPSCEVRQGEPYLRVGAIK